MLLALNPIKNDLKICDAFTFVNSVWKGLIRMYVHPLFKFDKILWWMSCADLEGGWGGSGPPLEFAKLNIADITGNDKISYFSYLCTSTVIRQTESILLKVGHPLEKFSGSAPVWSVFLSLCLTISLNYAYRTIVKKNHMLLQGQNCFWDHCIMKFYKTHIV